MSQSRKMSAVESGTQTAMGFIVAWAAWVWIVGPWFGYDVAARSGFEITLFFTFLSLVRQYVFRRLFNFIGKD